MKSDLHLISTILVPALLWTPPPTVLCPIH
jgi:hypothetical protein